MKKIAWNSFIFHGMEGLYGGEGQFFGVKRLFLAVWVGSNKDDVIR